MRKTFAQYCVYIYILCITKGCYKYVNSWAYPTLGFVQTWCINICFEWSEVFSCNNVSSPYLRSRSVSSRIGNPPKATRCCESRTLGNTRQNLKQPYNSFTHTVFGCASFRAGLAHLITVAFINHTYNMVSLHSKRCQSFLTNTAVMKRSTLCKATKSNIFACQISNNSVRL